MYKALKITMPQQRLISLFVTIITVFVLTSCGDKQTTIASVNGKDITKEAFNAYTQFKRINTDDSEKYQATLDDYINREALASVIEQQKVLDQSLIAAELKEFRKEMLISRYFDKLLADKVSEDAIRNYYVANESLYETKQYHVSHILLRTKSGMSDIERNVKLTTAQEAHSKLKAGKAFEDIAKEFSEDTISGKKGGDLGWIKEGAIDSNFNEVVKALKPGELSKPFESTFGYHIVKLIDGPRTVKKPFESVKGDIRYKLRNQAKQAELTRLQGLAKIKKYEQ